MVEGLGLRGFCIRFLYTSRPSEFCYTAVWSLRDKTGDYPGLYIMAQGAWRRVSMEIVGAGSCLGTGMMRSWSSGIGGHQGSGWATD